ncbi:hypothetical protein AB1Y20_018432 [Prymnesium parvum]|uniref:Palmitoyltransferase n=1 Tax=Prymnesium parvum TaxID=97485 RepID=A0AB34JS77_PRYPA
MIAPPQGKRRPGRTGPEEVDATPRLVRAYTVWPARNTFCCYGHCMTGPKEDFGPNVCAWATILGIIALFFYVWGLTLVRVSVPLLVFLSSAFISTIVWFLATSFTDPGIIPRNPNPGALAQMPPLYQNRVEDGRTVTDTWCTTCSIYRPPRASHCPDCDNCVRDFDHHCPFTRNCIGARNYPFFILFLVSVSISLGGLIFSCFVLAGSVELNDGVLDPRAYPWQLNGFINTALIFAAIALALVLWGFTAYHLTLLITGFTTKERLKGRKNGAKSISIVERVACLEPSELEPRRKIPNPESLSKMGNIPTIKASEL